MGQSDIANFFSQYRNTRILHAYNEKLIDQWKYMNLYVTYLKST